MCPACMTTLALVTAAVTSTGGIAAIVASMWLLAYAARTLAIGTAYAVWVGIGAIGTAVLGIAIYREPVTPMRVVFLALLVVAALGGFYLATLHLRKALPPKAVVLLHAGLAVTGFLVLLSAVLSA